MGKTHITDMNDQLDDSGELSTELPGAVRKIASFNTLLIDEATQAFPAGDHDSRIRSPDPARGQGPWDPF